MAAFVIQFSEDTHLHEVLSLLHTPAVCFSVTERYPIGMKNWENVIHALLTECN